MAIKPLIMMPYILTLLTLALSITILALTTTLLTWSGQNKSTFPSITVSPTPNTPTATNTFTISAFPSRYNPIGLILNLVAGIGGMVDSLLLPLCLGCIDLIYRAGRTKFACVSKADAKRGIAPTWLWGVTIFIVVFSVCRSLLGFVGSWVGYYTSARLTVGAEDVETDGLGRYVAPGGGAFSFGGWVCQLGDVVVDDTEGNGTMKGMLSKGDIASLCAKEKAARGLTVSLFVVYVVLLGVLVARFRSEKRERASVMRVGGGKGGVVDSE
ncbi:hypothetical protein OHC33_006753 [Knufia fluminis]|uniref:Uncharacterized protein n=1 Tax=Knufia fluminis TaxID=191047 RepID=A0AAN8I7E9_9EURO|nr:hypothetical protein OHC33_006753 [Knufia fluminis]